MNILIKPIITEKATADAELNNKYGFEVNPQANKVETVSYTHLTLPTIYSV